MSSAFSWAQAPLTTGQSLSEPMITATLRTIFQSLSFSTVQQDRQTKKGCGTPVPRPLFPVFLSAHFAQGCTMPLIAVNVTPFHATRHQQHH
jgi:hypothetical protein